MFHLESDNNCKTSLTGKSLKGFTQFHLTQMFSHHHSAQDSALLIQVLLQLIGKDSDDGKDWREKEKGARGWDD